MTNTSPISTRLPRPFLTGPRIARRHVRRRGTGAAVASHSAAHDTPSPATALSAAPVRTEGARIQRALFTRRPDLPSVVISIQRAQQPKTTTAPLTQKNRTKPPQARRPAHGADGSVQDLPDEFGQAPA